MPLDNAYILNIGNFEEVPDIQQTPKYYSDHDAICITWEKIPEKSTEWNIQDDELVDLSVSIEKDWIENTIPKNSTIKQH